MATEYWPSDSDDDTDSVWSSDTWRDHDWTVVPQLQPDLDSEDSDSEPDCYPPDFELEHAEFESQIPMVEDLLSQHEVDSQKIEDLTRTKKYWQTKYQRAMDVVHWAKKRITRVEKERATWKERAKAAERQLKVKPQVSSPPLAKVRVGHGTRAPLTPPAIISSVLFAKKAHLPDAHIKGALEGAFQFFHGTPPPASHTLSPPTLRLNKKVVDKVCEAAEVEALKGTPAVAVYVDSASQKGWGSKVAYRFSWLGWRVVERIN
eukprot:TRINITY_DN65295_c1_g2_i5.p1 TRINITY_DN65295_c1_g2~~TRINITY_DN65295_c1_g2_i5.p1  ORF type:complete len:288 (-),score=15.38 TRINITY_DN65295_c1_g2_i5:1276-2061(-)